MTSRKKIPGYSALIVDDQHFVLDALEGLVGRCIAKCQTLTTNTIQKAVKLARKTPFDFAVIDAGLPDQGAGRLIQSLARLQPRCRVIVLDERPCAGNLHLLAKMPIWAYVTKQESAKHLETLLQSVAKACDASAASPLDPRTAPLETADVPTACAEWELLTPRERDVLKLLAEGLGIAKCAEFLGTSIKTVNNHKAAIMRKVNVHTQTQLVLWALRQRLVNVY